jgi:2-hydroxychromene-2-carboxylate isomerase
VLDRAERTETDRLDAAIRDNEAAQDASGHWGVPLMVFEGEPFFGQDRIDVLLWRMRQQGLRPRTAQP